MGGSEEGLGEGGDRGSLAFYLLIFRLLSLLVNVHAWMRGVYGMVCDIPLSLVRRYVTILSGWCLDMCLIST